MSTLSKSPLKKRFRDAVDADFGNKQLGENGMPEYTDAGVGSNLLALSQMVRRGDPTSLIKGILGTGSANEVADLFVLLFVTRNCRGGKGEKKLAYDIFLNIWVAYPETAKKMLALFPHYGYWKDLLLLMAAAKEEKRFVYGDDLIEAAVAIMKEQYTKDRAALEKYEKGLKAAMDEEAIESLKRKGPGISLLAKWLPRERSSFDKKIGFVDLFTKESGATAKEQWQSNRKSRYRREVAELTSYLALPEVLLAAKHEDEIQFGKMAAKATLRLRKVFLNEDKMGGVRSRDAKRVRLAERFLKHAVEEGLKGAQLMPHEIVEKIRSTRNVSKAEELVLDSQWKDLWKNVVEQVKAKAKEEGVEFSPTELVPLCDVSSSMWGDPINVAIAMSIGISEITHEAFKDRVLTFESKPQWHLLRSTDTIVQKVRSLGSAPWGGSTNFEAAYDLILGVVERNNIPREEVPSLIVFSDMQFDMAAGYYNYESDCSGTDHLTTMHDVVRDKFKALASRLAWEGDNDTTPMIYWNLRNTGGHPVDKDTEGAVLLSGFSPALLKLVMYGEALREQEVTVVEKDGSVTVKKVRVTPEEILRKMLNDKLYDPVREILANSKEDKLVEYEPIGE